MRFHPVIQTVDRFCLESAEYSIWILSLACTGRKSLGGTRTIEGGGVLKELGSHLFDLGYHWLGQYENVASYNTIIRPGREVEDYSVNVFNFKNGADGYLSTNYEDRRGRSIKGDVMGLDGQIEFQFSSYEPKDSQITLYLNGKKKKYRLLFLKKLTRSIPDTWTALKKK